MYTEITKIIEGGLVGDKEKVYNYANVLAKNLEETGDLAFAKKIQRVLVNKKAGMVSLDSLSSRPVDGESRMEIVDVCYPTLDLDKLIFDDNIEKEIDTFIQCYFNRDRIITAGIDVPKSLLLYGPPGCGKTTLAQYIALKVGLPLITARLDGMISSLLGSTAKNIRKIFEYASKQECVLFLDEFDVIAKVRDDKNEMGELKRVVNSLLQNIDMFSSNSIIVAATNHHELLDSAVWRRFNRILLVDRPMKEEIEKLIEVHLEKSNANFLLNKKKVKQIAKAMKGLSHSDIKTITSNCIMSTIINEKEEIDMMDIYKEIYLYQNHSISDEDNFIEYLLQNEMTHRELQACGFPLRKIQTISKDIRRDEDGKTSN